MTSQKDQWRETTLGPAIKRNPERRERFETESNIEVDTVYSDEDLEQENFQITKDLGYPG